ncbi:MAG: ATP-binding cassette domain-containing protein [Cyanobacteria bacterium]|nr:ATP-binding cassette domain-containing protein [Cyanobacteriota bacterium]
MSADDTQHLQPLDRFWALVKIDARDLSILISYTLVTGLLSLAVPLAAQAVVNTIAAGIFLQPLIVMTVLLFAGLLFVAVLRMFKLKLVETLQQRIFARVVMQLGARIPKIQTQALSKEYMPELVNRFFDVMTVQKAWGKLLLDVPASLLQVLIGLVLMAFYSPWLLAFDFAIIAFIIVCSMVLGVGGIKTSIHESHEKYRVAEWLEDLGRCHISFKTHGFPNFVLERSDQLVVNYLDARRSHFAVLFRQSFSTYLFQALASAGILAIGGWLVINRQLTLGQLVAAELVVLNVLSALEKLIRNCDTYYDLLTGLDKVGHLTDLPLERKTGTEMNDTAGGACVVVQDVCFRYHPDIPVLNNVNLTVEAGERASLVGASGAGKTTLAQILCGLLEPDSGAIEFAGMDVRDVNLPAMRRCIGFVGDANEIFEGTIEENVRMGREYVSHKDIRWALGISQLSEEIARLPEGMQTQLIASGKNFSRGQVQRLLIARAIAHHPSLLILDEAFTGIDEKTKIAIVDQLLNSEYPWTLIDISHDAEVVKRSDHIYVLADGQIAEFGSPATLSGRSDSEFSTLFPELATDVRRTERRKEVRNAGS